MRRQFVCFAVIYVVFVVVLWLFGIPTAIPWVFLPYLLTMVLPLAYAAEVAFSRAAPKIDAGPRGAVTAIALGLVLVGVNACVVAWPVVAIGVFLGAALHLVARRRALLAPLAVSCVTLLLLFGSVWNMNYLVGALAYSQRLDDVVLAWDVAAYQAVLGDTLQAAGMYPLLKSQAHQCGYRCGQAAVRRCGPGSAPRNRARAGRRRRFGVVRICMGSWRRPVGFGRER